MTKEAFSVRFDSALRGDLRRRLSEVRWSDAVTPDWQYGMNKSFLMALVDYWRTVYDFEAAEQRLNFLPQFRTQVEGFGVHLGNHHVLSLELRARMAGSRLHAAVAMFVRPFEMIFTTGWFLLLKCVTQSASQSTSARTSVCRRRGKHMVAISALNVCNSTLSSIRALSIIPLHQANEVN
jgi:hypothetical protein